MLLVDNGSTSCDSLSRSLSELGCEHVRMSHDQVGSVRAYAGVVLSGRAAPTRLSNVNNCRVIEEASRAGVPLLGICYGAEILALTFGGTLRRLPRGMKETRTITTTKRNRLLREKSFEAMEAHAFVVARLPPQLERLARSRTSENEAVAHKRAELYGVQFHPELSGESGKRILSNFIHLCARRDDGVSVAHRR